MVRALGCGPRGRGFKSRYPPHNLPENRRFNLGDIMSYTEELKSAKGVKDWYGRQAILRNHVRDTLRALFERYGYNPVETPVIEREELLSLKGGGAIQKEVFRLTDQGKRRLALRFDQTLPLARFYATHPELKSPYKRYAIGDVFRDGPTQPEQGRYRIFSQCDVDIIGVENMAAEAELLTLAYDAFRELGLGDVTVKINNRKALEGIMDVAGVPDSVKVEAILVLDKLEKIGIDEVKKELSRLGGGILPGAAVDALIGHTAIQGTNREKMDYLDRIMTSDAGRRGLEEIRGLLSYCKEMDFDFVEFDPSLARGLDYYSGTTIEVFMKKKDIIGSAIVAGGRFDNMIGDFRGAGTTVPAVGLSFGLERTCMAVESVMSGVKETVTELFIIPLNTLSVSLKIAHVIRRQNINVDIDLTGRSLKSAMRYADSLDIPFVGIIGENEVRKEVVTIKRLSDGLQNEIAVTGVKSYLDINRDSGRSMGRLVLHKP